MCVTMEHVMQHQRNYNTFNWVPARCAEWINAQLNFDTSSALFPRNTVQVPLYQNVTGFANLTAPDRK